MASASATAKAISFSTQSLPSNPKSPLLKSQPFVTFKTLYRSGSPSTFLGQALRIPHPPLTSLSRPPDLQIRAVDSKPTVLVAEKLGQAGVDLLRDFANVDCSYNLSPEELCSKISLCDALIVRSGTKVTKEVFEAARGRLKVVGRAGVGIDNVDLQAATEYGCLVVNAPTANTVAAAEHAIAMLASMARNVAQADASMKAGENSIRLNLILVLNFGGKSWDFLF